MRFYYLCVLFHFLKVQKILKNKVYVQDNTGNFNIIRFAFDNLWCVGFFNSPRALKQNLFLSLQGLLIGALTCFIIAEAQESYIAITVLEIFIVILFILIYMLTLHHLLTYIHWPLLVSVRFHNSNISFALGPRAEALFTGKHPELSLRARTELSSASEVLPIPGERLALDPSVYRATSAHPCCHLIMVLNTGHSAARPKEVFHSYSQSVHVSYLLLVKQTLCKQHPL